MGDGYTVDADELADVIAELVGCREVLERNLADLRVQMQTLQHTWEGLSADAQAVAQAEWDKGMATMNAALEELIAANRAAHGNYTGAWQANVSMWQALR